MWAKQSYNILFYQISIWMSKVDKIEEKKTTLHFVQHKVIYSRKIDIFHREEYLGYLLLMKLIRNHLWKVSFTIHKCVFGLLARKYTSPASLLKSHIRLLLGYNYYSRKALTNKLKTEIYWQAMVLKFVFG